MLFDRLKEAHAVIFHLRNFHFDGYKWPLQERRDPKQIWILLMYETPVNIEYKLAHSNR